MDNHSNCHESWCYNKKALLENKTYLAPVDHRSDKVKDATAYAQLKKNFDKYANVTQMGYCNHPFVTQTNEALNQSIAYSVPKSVCYSSTTSLNTRVALVIGIHNLGHLRFFPTYFQLVGLELGGSLTRFLARKESKKESKRKYQRLPTTKVQQSKEQQKNREDIYKERIDTSYGAGVGLTAGITKRRRIEKIRQQQ
jgi:hypothetical protein